MRAASPPRSARSRSWPDAAVVRQAAGRHGKGRSRAARARRPRRRRGSVRAADRPAVADRGQAGKTSPEELLAAAHAGCYSTSLAGEIARAGGTVERLDVSCTITLDEVEGKGHLIVSSELDVRARVPGSTRPGSSRRRGADEGCTFSALIRASASVSVRTRNSRARRGARWQLNARASVTWSGDLIGGSGTIDEVGERGVRAARRQLGRAIGGGVGREDEPGGADRRGACRVLLDGALERAREGGHSARAAADLGRGHLRAGHGDHEERSIGRGNRPGARRGRRSARRPRTRRRTARSRRRSPACPRSRSTRSSTPRARAPVPTRGSCRGRRGRARRRRRAPSRR